MLLQGKAGLRKARVVPILVSGFDGLALVLSVWAFAGSSAVGDLSEIDSF